jgi:hypothetical protein
MKKTLAVAAFLALGAGTMGVKALDLKGSDTLRSLTVQVINACSGATGTLVYKGTGSGAGESAIAADTQQIAPMSRFLAGSAPASGACSAADTSKAEAIEIAGDDIGLWFAQSHQSACDPGSATDTCQGYTNGGISFNKTLPNSGVVLTSWKDVIRLIYFGLRPSDFPLPTTPSEPNNRVSPAAIGRRDCRDAARNELRNNYASIFQNACDNGSGPNTGGCTKLQHAFRRDQNSGTTDFFREAVNVEAGANILDQGFPFCNEFIPAVTLNVASNAVAATGGTCTPNTATGCPTGYACLANGTQCKRPANGCTVATSATDCPATAKCDSGQLQCATTCTNDAGCTALGAGARCDTASGLCIKAVDGCSVDADCAAGFKCDAGAVPGVIGGTCAPACNLPDDGSCQAYLPGATCNATIGACTRPYGSICPSPGLVATSNPPSWTGTVAGKPGVARSVVGGLAVGFANQQDNDLLRWPAVGTYQYAALNNTPDTNPAEQVASLCGDLGLVLPISMPPTNPALPVDPAVYPNARCGKNTLLFAPATKIQTGLTSRYLLCPNGDMPFGGTWDAASGTVTGGTGTCLFPRQGGTSTDLRCLNGRNNGPTTRTSPPPIPLPTYPPPTTVVTPGAGADLRVYNLHVFGSGTAHATQPYTYNGSAQVPTPPPGEVESILTQPTVAAFYRIHSTRTLKAGADALCPGAAAPDGGACCAQSADTQQIGCLVEASPCSMGFAGLAAGDAVLTTNIASPVQSLNFAAGTNTGTTTTVTNVSPNGPNRCIQAGPLPLIQYPIARNLYVSSTAGFENLTGTANKDAQLSLMKCFTGAQALTSGTIQNLISGNGFVNLANYPCCRDFNEFSSCGVGTANVDACGNNGTVGIPSNICAF